MKLIFKKQFKAMLKFPNLALCAALLAPALALPGCGGGSGAGAVGTGSSAPGGGTTAPTSGSGATLKAKGVVLLTNQPNLPSDGKTSATITVFVKDDGNRALADAEVSLTSTDSGVIVQQATAKTGADGSISATVSLTSKTNRIVQIKATVGALTSIIDIPVTGTTVAINGPLSLAFGGTGEYSLAVKDSAGNAVPNTDVSVTSSAGNVFTPSTLKTDSNGQAKFSLKISKNGTDKVSATSGGGSASVSLTVAATQLSITGITTAEEVVVNAIKPVGVLMTESGVPVNGRTLRLSSTRGVISVLGGGSTVTTDASGRASFSIVSPNAGQSTITVADATSGNVTTSSIEFISTTPAVVKVQASKPVLAANAIGASGNSSELIATVKDASGNPVKGVVVDFSAVADPSNGRIEPASAVTDVGGNASVAFIAGPTVTGPDQVVLKAAVSGTSIAASTANLTVASRQVSIRLGTGNKIEVDEPTRYKFPWTAVVVDSSGAPIQNANVTVQVVPVSYFKGSWVKQGAWRPKAYDTDLAGVNVGAAPGIVINAQECPSEDVNRDGSLQTAEDLNDNKKLDPGNVATSDVGPAGKTTGVNGFVDFNVVYAKSFAEFTKIRIDVRAKVDGTESLVSETFILPLEATDATGDSPPVIPGSFDGPYGRIVKDQSTSNGINILPSGSAVSACNNFR
jgi:Bacterial Ig-like domain (group 1)